jgi:uncharacterized RDD family membrane protein YckC
MTRRLGQRRACWLASRAESRYAGVPMQNPYAPPSAEIAPNHEPIARLADRRLASRGKRLGAAVVDTLIAVVAGTILSRTYCALGSVSQSAELAQLGFLVSMVPQWFLIAKRGQSVGKMLFKIEIVVADGSRASFVHGVALRVWPILFASMGAQLMAPALRTVISVISLVDMLFIFRSDHRCLHDRVAGTYVVDASAPGRG